MITIELPWAAWYGDGRGHSVSLPDGWDIEICSMQGGTDIGDDGIRQRLDAPIGADRLQQLAGKSDSAAILVDDLSRPTPAFRLLPYLLEQLHAGGIEQDQITIIGAVVQCRRLDKFDHCSRVRETRAIGCSASKRGS